jgi:hypothetical protein
MNALYARLPEISSAKFSLSAATIQVSVDGESGPDV